MIGCVLRLELHLEMDEGEDIVLSVCFIAGYLGIGGLLWERFRDNRFLWDVS